MLRAVTVTMRMTATTLLRTKTTSVAIQTGVAALGPKIQLDSLAFTPPKKYLQAAELAAQAVNKLYRLGALNVEHGYAAEDAAKTTVGIASTISKTRSSQRSNSDCQTP